MPYWTSETLQDRLQAKDLISPFDADKINHCAYELAMGPEAFITSTEARKKIELDDGEPLVIPPGQFALLLTQERIKVPLNAIAFISMRFGWKRRGLINVSGFHVDPGFAGRLKFSVYNAGSNPITITQGDRVFLIWYADLNGTTEDGYNDPGPDQDRISSDDQNLMHGEIASPAELKSQIEKAKRELNSEIDKLQHLGVNIKVVAGVCLTLLGAILLRLLFMSYLAPISSSEFERLRNEVMTDVRQEFSEFEQRKKAIPTPTAAGAGGATDDRPALPRDQGHATDTSGGLVD